MVVAAAGVRWWLQRSGTGPLVPMATPQQASMPAACLPACWQARSAGYTALPPPAPTAAPLPLLLLPEVACGSAAVQRW